MDVCSVFNFNGFCEVLNKSPKLALDLVLCDWLMGVGHWVKWRFAGEMGLLEGLCLLLELLERVHAAVFEPKLASTDEASRAVPIVLEWGLDWWLKAITVEGVIAAVTD
jgi:hypothetical protein